MASLLDHNFPEVPTVYDPDVFARIMRDLEMALTKIEFPEVLSGQDDLNALAWFAESGGGSSLEIPVPVASGGTGVTSIAALKTALAIGPPVPVASGGTGVTSLAALKTALGITDSMLFVTGMVQSALVDSMTGWLKLRGQTMGSAASGATEASGDNEALFKALWDAVADAEAPVSSGRGANAQADWDANKTITLIDARGRAPAGLDNMGGASANVLTNAAADALGDLLGDENETPTEAKTASHSHGVTRGTTSGGSYRLRNNVGSHTAYQPTANTGSGTDLDIVQPTFMVNWFIKL